MRIEHSHIIITGATGGLGSALIKVLHAHDCTITAIGRNADILQTLEHDYGVIPLKLDLTNALDMQHFAQYVAQNPPHILINSAAVLNIEHFETCPYDSIADTINLNITAVIQATRICLPSMLKTQKPCKVINIGSAGGDLALPYFTTYCATKFALKGFTESLKRELATTNVQPVLFAPRAMRTPMMDENAVRMLRALLSGMDDVDKIAKKLVQVIGKNQSRKRIGFIETMGGLVNGVFPWFMDIFFRIATPIMKKYVPKD